MANTKKPSAPPPPSRRLNTISECRRELARLYWEARAGTLDVSEASRLANMLQILSRLIAGDDIERRLQELEQQIGHKR